MNTSCCSGLECLRAYDILVGSRRYIFCIFGGGGPLTNIKTVHRLHNGLSMALLGYNTKIGLSSFSLLNRVINSLCKSVHFKTG